MKKLILAATVIIFLLSVTGVHAGTYAASIDLPAVSSDGIGVLSPLDVEIVPGKGRVLLTISPFTGIQTQSSEIIAVDVAEQYTKFDFSKYDVIFTINAGQANVVDGPSAGAAMAVAVIAAVEQKQVREDAGITGTIQPDGTIGAVGGIFEKAVAAAQGGDKIFVIPEGTAVQPVTVEKIENPAPGWTIKRVTTEYVDITKQLEEEHGITVEEVSNIGEAVDILLNGKDATASGNKSGEAPGEYENIAQVEASDLAKPMQSMAEWQINNTEALREEAKEKLANPSLDQVKSELLQSIFSSVDAELAKAQQAYEKGYLYGAANYAFRAGITAKYVHDLAEYYTLNSADQVKFIGDRITEATEKTNAVKELVNENERLAADSGAYEWAVSAQERVAQAESQLAEKSETSEGILYSLATVESWAGIAGNFMKIADEHKTGTLLGTGKFENKSSAAITRAEAEVGQLQQSQDTNFGADWYLKVAKKEQEEKWFVASFIDASTASMRLETITEINTRGWTDLVSYIEVELASVNASNSAWAELYRDYGRLVLQKATDEMDVSQLTEAMIYARQAKLYSELGADYQSLEPAGGGVMWKETAIITVFVVLFGLMVLGYKKEALRKRISYAKMHQHHHRK